MTRSFTPAAAPHIPAQTTVRGVMLQVLLALAPAIVAYVFYFGPGVLVQIILASAFALVLEALMLRLRGRPLGPFLGDYSAVVTAVLFALCIPPLAPWWIALVAMIFAIIVAKHLFGGLGNNIFNPAMVGYVVVLISFPQEMTQWLLPRELAGWTPGLLASLETIFTGTLQVPAAPGAVDGITGATPLDTVKTGLAQGLPVPDIRSQAIFGAFGGLGWEWIAGWYLVGGLFLLYRRVISWQVPVATLGAATAVGLGAWLLDPSTNPQPLAADLFRWSHAGSIFHRHRPGQRLRQPARAPDFWRGSGHHHAGHPALGRLPGRHRLCRAADELRCTADRPLHAPAGLRTLGRR